MDTAEWAHYLAPSDRHPKSGLYYIVRIGLWGEDGDCTCPWQRGKRQTCKHMKRAMANQLGPPVFVGRADLVLRDLAGV
jgi:hypothetical protein